MLKHLTAFPVPVAVVSNLRPRLDVRRKQEAVVWTQAETKAESIFFMQLLARAALRTVNEKRQKKT